MASGGCNGVKRPKRTFFNISNVHIHCRGPSNTFETEIEILRYDRDMSRDTCFYHDHIKSSQLNW